MPTARKPVPIPTYAHRSLPESLGAMLPAPTPTAIAASAVRHHAR